MPRLSPAAFDAFLAGNIGQEFLWRRASACPCVNPSSGSANPQCSKCFGKGRLWAKPVPARAGMTQQTINKTWAQLGIYEIGDATLTIPQKSAMYEAGQFDRIQMLNSTDRFDLVFVHGDDDRRLYFAVKSIDRVFWYTGPNDGTGDIVEGKPPQFNNDDGSLTWPAGGEPPVGKQYSMTGVRFSEYFVWNALPSDRNEHFGARLPKKLIARRFDLFGRSSAPPI